MPKREPIFSREDTTAQDRHRPDQPESSSTPGKAQGTRKRDHQDQLNVLIRKGNAKRFRMKAWTEDTTMSDLIDQWVAEYLAGKL